LNPSGFENQAAFNLRREPMNVHIARQRLTDGSHVYEVALHDDGRCIQLPAMSEDDAWQLADKIGRAINEHSTQRQGTDFTPEITCNYPAIE
jgi:hypothetical protein